MPRIAGLAMLLAGLAVALWCPPARALHRESPGAYRITMGGTHRHPSGRSWDNWLAFVSSQDLVNTGSATQQIFLFNLAYFDCWRGTTLPTTACPNPLKPFLTQVTNRPGSPDNPSIAKIPDGGGTHWLAFDADGTMLGATGPASAHRQVFLKNLITEELRQVTFGTDGDSVRPSVSSLAGLVVFESTASLAGLPSPGGVSQVFSYETQLGILRQITAGAGASANPSTNKNGTVIAFQSSADLLGDGHDTGVSQIFWSAYDRAAHTSTLQRLTAGDAPSRNPVLPEIENVVAFESDATNLGGIPGGTQVYVSSSVNVSPVTVRQLTFQPRFGDCREPALDPGGNRVGMICTGDPLENGTTGNRLFVLDYEQMRLFQITGAGDVQGPIGHNLGRWFVAVSTTSDLTGLGSCGYQLHFIDYFVDEPGHWNAATAIGQLPPDVVPTPGIEPVGTVIGKQTMTFMRGDATGGGSQLAITTPAGTFQGLVPQYGRMVMIGGAPDGEFTRTASVRVPMGDLIVPPVAVPGIGTVCLTASADGGGQLDCAGGNMGGTIVVSEDQGGLLAFTRTGSAQAGEMQLQLPLLFSISQSPGIADPRYCTADDNYVVRDVPITMYLTTGQVNATVVDADAVAGSNLTASATGGPFVCPALQAGVMAGARFEGAATALDVPGVPVLHDVVVRLSLMPSLEPTCSPPCSVPADCDDGNPCNGAETCVSGACGTGTPITCDDGDPCNGAETCDPTTGACLPGPPCDDGDPCNGVETCDLLAGCQPGIPIVCTDGDACNGLETCDPATATCQPGAPPACDDSDPCNGLETCDPATGCVPGTPILCSDGDFCNGEEVCDPGTGACGPGVPPTCDDTNSCTGDVCDPALGCLHTNLVGPCDDTNPCTTDDQCLNGLCVGLAVLCSDGSLCNGFEFCDPLTGLCQGGLPLDCDDGNLCTDDVCDAVLGCLHANNAAACDDGNLCTTPDACQAGTCVGTPLVCSDGNVCNGAETCNPATGTCQPGTALACTDGNPCTDDGCDAALGCLYANNTAACDDGDLCTTTDTCQAGTCVGIPLLCDDGTVCNGTETCNPATGTCQPGTPVGCDDGNVCTDDLCDPVAGCLYANNTAACNDLDPCTLGDTCQAGTCVGTLDLTCAGSALQNAVVSAPPEIFMSARLQQRLARRIEKIQAKIETAFTPDPQRAIRSFRTALRLLAAFTRRVERAAAHGKLDPVFAQELLGRASRMKSQVSVLLSALQGYPP